MCKRNIASDSSSDNRHKTTSLGPPADDSDRVDDIDAEEAAVEGQAESTERPPSVEVVVDIETTAQSVHSSIPIV